MKYGFDIDGTITAAPKAFSAIMKSLRNCGHEVHILTGQTKPIVPSDFEFRKRQLTSIGINSSFYDELFIAGPPNWVKDKAHYCRDNEIELMFENDVAYAQAISEFTPTTVMWVH